jgi:hypothetical protein
MELPSIRRTCTGKGNGSSPIGWLVASGSIACFMGSTLQQTYRLGSERKDNMSSNHRLCLGVRDCTIIS